MRYFNNFYGQFLLSPKVGFTTGFDVGVQQRTRHSSSYDAWLSPVLIARYTFTDNWAAALRAEYYQDPTGIIIRTGTLHESGLYTHTQHSLARRRTVAEQSGQDF